MLEWKKEPPFKECGEKKREKEKEKEEKKIVYGINELWFRAFSLLNTKGMTVLLICQSNNLVGGRINNLSKSEHCPI